MTYTAERTNRPVSSTSGARVASAAALPWFLLLRPAGYGVLTTTGRRTGKARRKCVRAIRRGDCVYLVSILGDGAAWLKNFRAHPTVGVRIRGGTYDGYARELHDPAETNVAARAYRDQIFACDFVTCALHRRGFPTRAKASRIDRRVL